MKIKEITKDSIVFDNGTVMSHLHIKDCCEKVYADFLALKYYNVVPHSGKKTTIFEVEFNDDIQNRIVLVPEIGFYLVSSDDARWLVPCYDEQNGYYSSNLTLCIDMAGSHYDIDITNCTIEMIECLLVR